MFCKENNFCVCFCLTVLNTTRLPLFCQCESVLFDDFFTAFFVLFFAKTYDFKKLLDTVSRCAYSND